MKKIYKIAGSTLIGLSFLFIALQIFIRTNSAGEDFSRDILGLAVPTPPIWLSYIPYVGSVIGFIWEFFSMHGIVGILIFFFIFSLGSHLIDASKPKTKEADENSTPLSDQPRNIHTNVKEHYSAKIRAKRFFQKFIP